MFFLPSDISEMSLHWLVLMPTMSPDISEILLCELLILLVDKAALQSLSVTVIALGEALLSLYGPGLSWPSILAKRQMESLDISLLNYSSGDSDNFKRGASLFII